MLENNTMNTQEETVFRCDQDFPTTEQIEFEGEQYALEWEITKGVMILPIVFAAAGTALANFAEGAILAASVYLVSRGVRNPLKTKK